MNPEAFIVFRHSANHRCAKSANVDVGPTSRRKLLWLANLLLLYAKAGALVG
jgi:hypothetical protein